MSLGGKSLLEQMCSLCLPHQELPQHAADCSGSLLASLMLMASYPEPDEPTRNFCHDVTSTSPLGLSYKSINHAKSVVLRDVVLKFFPADHRGTAQLYAISHSCAHESKSVIELVPAMTLWSARQDYVLERFPSRGTFGNLLQICCFNVNLPHKSLRLFSAFMNVSSVASAYRMFAEQEKRMGHNNY